MQKESSSITEERETDFGLKEDWFSIEETLRALIPVYDKTNRFISLGSDLKLRRDGIEILRKALRKESASILDLGCGPGKMTEMLWNPKDSLLSDALLPMVRIARERNLDSPGIVLVYEELPFREGSFDAALAGFALRDARNLVKSLRQICSVLKNGGFFLVVDLCKPDSMIRRGLIGIYWRLIAPIIALVASGRLGLKFAALFTTYQRLPKNSELERLFIDAGFDIIENKYRMLNGAFIILLRRV